MLTRTAKVSLNTVSNLIRFALSIGIFFFLTPFIINSLGNDNFGLWSLVMSFLGLLELLDMGFGTGVVKFVAETKATGDSQKRNKLISSIWAMYTSISLATIVGIAVLSPYFSKIFNISAQNSQTALALLWILALRMTILSLPLSIYRGILFGEQHIWQINIIQAFALIFYSVTAWAFLSHGFGLIALALINLAAMLFEYGLYFILAHKQINNLELKFSLVEKKCIKEVSSFSIYSFFLTVASLILLRTDPLIVKYFMTLEHVAIYTIALKIADKTHLFSKQFINVLSPMISELKANREETKLRFVLINCSRFALIPTLLLGIPVLTYAREIPVLWLGKSFYYAGEPLILLLIAMILSVPEMVASNVLTMTGLNKEVAKAAMISVVINLVVSLSLVTTYGLNGVAAGTLIATLLVNVIWIPVLVSRYFNLGFISYWTRILKPLAPPILVNFACCFFLKSSFPSSSLFKIGLLCIPGSLLFIAVWYIFSVESSEKELIRERLFKYKKLEKGDREA